MAGSGKKKGARCSRRDHLRIVDELEVLVERDFLVRGELARLAHEGGVGVLQCRSGDAIAGGLGRGNVTQGVDGVALALA